MWETDFLWSRNSSSGFYEYNWTIKGNKIIYIVNKSNENTKTNNWLIHFTSIVCVAKHIFLCAIEHSGGYVSLLVILKSSLRTAPDREEKSESIEQSK